MTSEEIKSKLVSKKSSDRCSAAKIIGKENLIILGPDLFTAFLKEKEDQRTWETQSEMIKSLGIVNYKDSLPEIYNIVKQNIPHDAKTISAATTYVRLKRTSINDGSPVLELLSFGSTSVICGALDVLCLDKMVPSDDEIIQILKISLDINKHKDRIGHEYGLIDPRIYVASVCSVWNKSLTSDFLNHCIKTAYDISSHGNSVKNQNLIDVCEKALKGKYTKLG